jgi:putative transposase
MGNLISPVARQNSDLLLNHDDEPSIQSGLSPERTVMRWMRKAPRDPEAAKRWAAFLSNHREAIAAMDFFTVPTLTFGVLYCFFVIARDRRRILHCTVTKHPNSAWVVQQLREAFPYDSAPGYLIFDRGASFNEEVIDTVKSFGIQPKRTSFRSPWQNGVGERWVGNCRREVLDHVILLNQGHLKRLMMEYIRYYNYASYCPTSLCS